MPKYKIKYTIESWYEVEIEADDRQDARAKFDAFDYHDNSKEIGSELQDSVIVEEVK